MDIGLYYILKGETQQYLEFHDKMEISLTETFEVYFFI